MPRSSLILLSLSLLALGACTDRRAEEEAGPPLARGLSVETVAIYQGVEVLLLDRGDDQPDNTASVVAGRDAMLRVFVNRGSSFDSRDILAALEIKNGDEIETLELTENIDEDSAEDDLDTTFNFDLGGDQIEPDTEFAVTLYEVDADVEAAGNSDEARYPRDGKEFAEIGAEVTGAITIVIFPIQYNGPGGGGRLPDTSDAQIELFQQKLYSLYPTDELIIEVRDPMAWSQQIAPSGAGWGELLNEIATRRDSANVDPSTYYYGLMNPAASMYDFCSQGCVAGLSLLGGPNDAWSRASIGLGYTGEGSVDTMAHEVGHAHGRAHTPCGLGGQQSDPGYPNNSADLDVVGYDLLEGRLRNTTYKDMMSYCDPLWISAYTYNGMFERVQAISAQSFYIPPAGFQRDWRSLVVDMDGGTHLGHPFELDRVPEGEPVSLQQTDEDGMLIGESTGYFIGTSHLPGGMILFPAPPAQTAAVGLAGGTLHRLR